VKEKKDNQVNVQLFSGAQEHVLYCHSERREQKEQAMMTQFQERFETDLKQALAALSKKSGTKKYDKVLQRIGRLQEKYAAIAHYYEITVTQKDGIATDIKWVFEKKEKAQERVAGAYFLRTSRTDLSDEKTVWSLYTMLTDVEEAFRCLKSDLNLRPVFHQKESRSDAHLFEGVLAYHLLNSIRFKLKQHGINYRWKTVRDLLSSQIRVTTTVVNKKGQKLYIRNCTEPEPFHRAVYKALGLTQTILPNKKLVI
ncbi:MAG: transposase, partial [Gammaproteobacteria bacterium]|nr:transposase [Gammaproteobacteria bacterium]